MTTLKSFDALAMDDPFALYEAIRREADIFYDEKSKHWVLLRHADVHAVMGDEKRFSAAAERESFAGLCPKAAAILQPVTFSGMYGLSSTENPDHDRLKRAAMPAFNDQYLKRLKPKLAVMADEQLNQLAGRTTVDLLSEVANPFPVRAIFEVLGVPSADVARVKEWSGSRMALTWGEGGEDEQVRHALNVVRYWEYSCDLVDHKMANPGYDLVSEVGVAIREGRLTRQEGERFCYGLLFSGHATTSAFLTESFRFLLANGGWEDVATGRVSAAATTDELLRLCPSAITRRRSVLEDVNIRGQHIPKGAILLLVIGSANRDEAVFDESNEYRPHRPNANKHLSFGYGFHYCIGAKIVKMEHATLLDRLTRRFPQMRLAPDYRPRYRRNLSIRMLDSLMVTLA